VQEVNHVQTVDFASDFAKLACFFTNPMGFTNDWHVSLPTVSLPVGNF